MQKIQFYAKFFLHLLNNICRNCYEHVIFSALIFGFVLFLGSILGGTQSLSIALLSSIYSCLSTIRCEWTRTFKLNLHLTSFHNNIKNPTCWQGKEETGLKFDYYLVGGGGGGLDLMLIWLDFARIALIGNTAPWVCSSLMPRSFSPPSLVKKWDEKQHSFNAFWSAAGWYCSMSTKLNQHGSVPAGINGLKQYFCRHLYPLLVQAYKAPSIMECYTKSC